MSIDEYVKENEKLPPRISRLLELANNLWWSRNEEGRQIFRALDYGLWRTSGHNPVKQIHSMSLEKIEDASRDPAFLGVYDTVMAKFDEEMTRGHEWCGSVNMDKPHGQIAYFSD